jgi:hypothetical protein
MTKHDPEHQTEIHEGGYGSPTVEEEMPDPAEANSEAADSTVASDESSTDVPTD